MGSAPVNQPRVERVAEQFTFANGRMSERADSPPRQLVKSFDQQLIEHFGPRSRRLRVERASVLQRCSERAPPVRRRALTGVRGAWRKRFHAVNVTLNSQGWRGGRRYRSGCVMSC